ncbi:unnamed protein product [Rhizophagus irregularis]|nr:unnamed protein product [Rhizophagus irregularis]
MWDWICTERQQKIGAAINFIRKWGNNSNNSIIFTKSEYDYEEAMSAFEGLQIKPIYLPIDIRLTVNEICQFCYDRKSCPKY